jgi:hypothetical protein
MLLNLPASFSLQDTCLVGDSLSQSDVYALNMSLTPGVIDLKLQTDSLIREVQRLRESCMHKDVRGVLTTCCAA